MPLLVKWPGVTKPGSVCQTPVITPGSFPNNVGDGEGQAPPTGQPVDGEKHRSLAEAIRFAPARGDLLHHRITIRAARRPDGAIRQGDWKPIEFF